MAERWVVTGASGQLGGHVLRRLCESPAVGTGDVLALAGRGEVSVGDVTVRRVDLGDVDAVGEAVSSFAPTHVLHVGAMTAVSDAHARPADAERVNVTATQRIVEMAARSNARVIFTSTDMVFDGRSAPYREEDEARPLSVYGRTKLAAEDTVRAYERGLVVRLPLMYGFPCTDRPTTFGNQVAALREGRPLRLFTDEFRTPVWLVDAARALLALARSEACGVMHVAGPERLSRYELVERVAQLLGIESPRLTATSRLDLEAAEPRPADLSLDGLRFVSKFPDAAPGPIRPEVIAED